MAKRTINNPKAISLSFVLFITKSLVCFSLACIVLVLLKLLYAFNGELVGYPLLICKLMFSSCLWRFYKFTYILLWLNPSVVLALFSLFLFSPLNNKVQRVEHINSTMKL